MARRLGWLLVGGYSYFVIQNSSKNADAQSLSFQNIMFFPPSVAVRFSRARAGEEHYEFSKLGNQREARDHQCAPRDPQWTGTVGLKPNQSKMVDHN
jgi:hypothetical protein